MLLVTICFSVMFLKTRNSDLFWLLWYPLFPFWLLKNPPGPPWVPDMLELTVLFEMVVEPCTEFGPVGMIPLHSSSRSLSFVITLQSCLCLSSSYIELSLIVNNLFLFTKLLVPGLPAKSQLTPFQCCLKLLWMCFNLSNADISLGFFDGGGTTFAGWACLTCC